MFQSSGITSYVFLWVLHNFRMRFMQPYVDTKYVRQESYF